MPRFYGEKFLLELDKNTSEDVGIRLARLCVKANLPATYISRAFEVTPTTIHNWFRGSQGVSKKNAKALEVFIDLVTEDLGSGRLPASNFKDAKAYIREMIGDMF